MKTFGKGKWKKILASSDDFDEARTPVDLKACHSSISTPTQNVRTKT
jgi:hypothetical protein